jgi:predicted SAM-dependent methyltransferase
MKNQVIIGAGEQRWEGWIATQQDELDLLKPETFQKFFADERAEKLLCEHT